MTSSFTGEDERFAYGRARSRLWEMCGERWHERSDPGWWRPLPLEVRRWEQPAPTEMASIVEQSYVVASDVKMGEHVELEKHAGLQRMEELDQSERDRNK
jgi:protein AFG1